MNIANVIKKAHLTEQSTKEGEKGKYTFLVDRRADKDQIKFAISKAYKVDVKSVQTILTKGKTKRVGVRRNEISVPSYKKAVVELKKGQTLTSAIESVTDNKKGKK